MLSLILTLAPAPATPSTLSDVPGLPARARTVAAPAALAGGSGATATSESAAAVPGDDDSTPDSPSATTMPPGGSQVRASDSPTAPGDGPQAATSGSPPARASTPDAPKAQVVGAPPPATTPAVTALAAGTAGARERVALFVQPLGIVPAALFFHSGLASLGAQASISEATSLTFDVTFVVSPGTSPTAWEDFRGTTSVAVSGGPTYRLDGEGLSGLFLTPKLMTTVSANHRRVASGRCIATSAATPCVVDPRPSETERWTTVELGVGADISYQKSWGPFFVGAVFGFGAGFALGGDAQRNTPSTFGGAAIWDDPPAGAGLTWSVNIHFLRIGVVL